MSQMNVSQNLGQVYNYKASLNDFKDFANEDGNAVARLKISDTKVPWGGRMFSVVTAPNDPANFSSEGQKQEKANENKDLNNQARKEFFRAVLEEFGGKWAAVPGTVRKALKLAEFNTNGSRGLEEGLVEDAFTDKTMIDTTAFNSGKPLTARTIKNVIDAIRAEKTLAQEKAAKIKTLAQEKAAKISNAVLSKINKAPDSVLGYAMDLTKTGYTNDLKSFSKEVRKASNSGTGFADAIKNFFSNIFDFLVGKIDDCTLSEKEKLKAIKKEVGSYAELIATGKKDNPNTTKNLINSKEKIVTLKNEIVKGRKKKNDDFMRSLDIIIGQTVDHLDSIKKDVQFGVERLDGEEDVDKLDIN